MKIIVKVLLSINLSLCLLSSSTMAMEELKKGRIPSRPTTAQAGSSKGESRPATTTRGVKRPRITFKEAAKAASDVKAAAFAAKKARLAQVSEAAKKALTKPPQLGAGVLTPRSGPSQKTKQTPLLLDTQMVTKKNGKGDPKGPSEVDQTSSSSRSLSLESRSFSPRKRAFLTSLSVPLVREIFCCLLPRELCRLAPISSKIRGIIDTDKVLWDRIYHQEYPHKFFNDMRPSLSQLRNASYYRKQRETMDASQRWVSSAHEREQTGMLNAMRPEDREVEITQFKDALRQLSCPIDPENPGIGFRKALKFYSDSSKVRVDFSFRMTTNKTVLESSAAIAILLRNNHILANFQEALIDGFDKEGVPKNGRLPLVGNFVGDKINGSSRFFSNGTSKMSLNFKISEEDLKRLKEEEEERSRLTEAWLKSLESAE